jgi:hypothetical protein
MKLLQPDTRGASFIPYIDHFKRQTRGGVSEHVGGGVIYFLFEVSLLKCIPHIYMLQ